MLPFLITGPPRSGTSLLSTTICQEIPNAYCSNECNYSIANVRGWLQWLEENLQRGFGINKVTDTGELLTNVGQGIHRKTHPVEQAYTEGGAVGSKVNTIYLQSLDALQKQNLLILGLIRDPVYTIASWYSDKCQGMNLAHVTDDDMDDRWQDFAFQTEEKLTRQAELWNWHGKQMSKIAHVFRYEDFTEDSNAVLWQIQQLLGLDPIEINLSLENYNRDDRYEDVEDVRKAVHRYCPVRTRFGY